MNEIDWYVEASLVSPDGHVYCAGTLVQCLRRWTRLSETDRLLPMIKIGRDGVQPTILAAAQIAGLAGNPGASKA